MMFDGMKAYVIPVEQNDIEEKSMKQRYAFLLAEFLYLKLETITTQLEKDFKNSNEEVFLFVGKPLNSPQAYSRNENIIFNLARSKNFDGILAFTNTLTPYDGHSIYNQYLNSFNKSKVISIGETLEGCSSIKLDNVNSIKLTINHLVDHGLRQFVYIGGPLSNQDAHERLQGVQEFFKEHPTLRVDIYEGDYSYEYAANVIHHIFAEHKPLPEAFVCANDEMAIGAYEALRSKGCKVPEEVKIVGFDDNDRGRHLESPLTTINQGFYNMVRNGFEIVKEGKVQNQALPGELVIRESCGCQPPIKAANEEYVEKKVYIEKYQQLHQSLMDNLELQAQLSFITTYDQLLTQLKALLGHYQNFEFHICFFKETSRKIEDPLQFQFPEDMHCFLSFIKGEFIENIDFKSENILPDVITQKSETNVFFVYPLRVNNTSYGYIVCNSSTAVDRRFVSLKDLLNITCNHIQMQREIDSYKLELENLSFKDSLTRSYNHRGFHRFAQPHFESSLAQGLTPAVIYGDVDYLKLINDTYGHENGDIIIVAASELLNEMFPNEIVARIGGDEFIVFIKDFSSYRQSRLNEDLTALMNIKSKELNKAFIFRMSFGFCIYDGLKHHSLEDMIREADNLLYETRKASNHYYSNPQITK
jgi:diguanylate cyclase (GGDEF)-like protein